MPDSDPRFVTTREGRVAWIESGPNEVGAANEPPLVLIHGFTGHRDDFLGVLAQLAGPRRVIVPDLRGHGDSDANPGSLGWSFEQMVKDLDEFLASLDIPLIDLLGHSMGGFVSLRFALAHPEKVRSLSFLCTGPETPSSLPRSGFEKAAAIAEARGMTGLQVILEKVGRVDASASIKAWGEGYWLHHRRRFGAMTPASYAGIGTEFFSSPSLVSRLPAVTQPTLVMVGEFDEDWLPGAGLFVENLPFARRVILRGAEHHPHQENTPDFLSALEDYLKAVGDADQSA